MARIRSIKPEFFKNEQLAELPYEDRLLFAGLWTQADRAGRLEDRPKRLKAELFPYDDLDIDAALGRLANAKLIERYDVNGQRLISIPTWGKHQQPHVREVVSVIPAPPCQYSANTSREQCEHGARTPDQEGKDQEGKEYAPALSARFERFWAAYPRKVGKDAAWVIWRRRAPDDALTNVMISAVDRQRFSAQWTKEDGAFIPHPRTWLSQGRWQDDETTTHRATTEAPGVSARAYLDRMAAEHPIDPPEVRAEALRRMREARTPRKSAQAGDGEANAGGSDA